MRHLKTRPRRMRRTPGVRALVRECEVGPPDLVMPVFVREGIGQAEEVESMPGVHRHSPAGLVEECRRLAGWGIGAVALFPCCLEEKDESGSGALERDGLVPSTLRRLKRELPDLIVICDVALDPYTDHGHDGVLSEDGREVDNDATVAILAQMALVLAEAGCDWVAPSDMMDGRVGAIRQALDAEGHDRVPILSYAAKFNSAFYGPFREAVGSRRHGAAYLDKGGYQLPPSNAREALRDALLDEGEGADMLMVKPAGPYLDILCRLRESTALPLAAYQVSGEYAQIHAAAQRGWLDYDRARDESLLAIKRAGADLVLTYFARELACRGRWPVC